jgi:hypothetical protein
MCSAKRHVRFPLSSDRESEIPQKTMAACGRLSLRQLKPVHLFRFRRVLHPTAPQVTAGERTPFSRMLRKVINAWLRARRVRRLVSGRN